jgi:excisionase family DNA binding protein
VAGNNCDAIDIKGVAYGSELTHSVGSHYRVSEVKNAYQHNAIAPADLHGGVRNQVSGTGMQLMTATGRHTSPPNLTEVAALNGSLIRDSVVSGRRECRLVAIGAAADYLSVSRATVERLVFRGELPIVKVGGSTRYDVDDLNNYIEINRRRNRRRSA